MHAFSIKLYVYIGHWMRNQIKVYKHTYGQGHYILLESDVFRPSSLLIYDYIDTRNYVSA